jgi:hypothetical protein
MDITGLEAQIAELRADEGRLLASLAGVRSRLRAVTRLLDRANLAATMKGPTVKQEPGVDD